MNICEFHNDLQATLGIILLQIDCRVWFNGWFEYFRFRLLDMLVIKSAILNPHILEPVTKIGGPKRHIPQWNGSINYALNESIEIFVFEWVKVVNITRNSGGTEEVQMFRFFLGGGFSHKDTYLECSPEMSTIQGSHWKFRLKGLSCGFSSSYTRASSG